MMKKTVSLLLVLISCSLVFAEDINIFNGDSDGTSWSDPNNWSLGHTPIYNTSPYTELSYVGRDATGDLNVVIDDSHARGGKAWLGRPEDPDFTYTLNLIDDAYYYLVRLYIGPRGVFIQDSGKFDAYEGRFDGSEITINDGLFTVRSNWWGFFANATPGKGVTTINGGTLRIKNGTTFSRLTTSSTPYNPEFTGVWDLRGGQVVMDGNVSSELQWHINHGNIVVYGGVDPNYVPEAVYSSSTNQTTLKAAMINKWIGEGDGSTWHDPNNWSLGTLPTYNTDHSMLTYIGMDATGDYDVTISKNFENDGTRAHSGRAWMGRPEDPAGTYTLNIPTGGEYYLVRHYVGPKGVLNIDGGIYNVWEGRYDGCQININSGTFIVRGPLWNFFNGSVTTINDGMLRIKNGDNFSYYASGIETRNPNFTTGTWDLCGGKVVMDGDCRAALQWHIDNGNIIAYGGSDPDFELDMVYNPSSNTTTIYSDTTAVRNIWPADGITLTVDDRQTIQLNWQPGRDVENLDGYNVYIADPNIPDPNLIALTLVNNPAVPYTGTSWQIPGVALGKTYTWRVDAVTDDGANVITGDVWSVAIDDEFLTLYAGGHLSGPLDYQWIGCGDGTSWNDALNWHSEYSDPNKAIPIYANHEGDLIESRMAGTITTGWSVGGTLFLGYGVDQIVDVSSPGTLWQLYRLYNYTDGTVNIAPDCTAHWVRLDNNGGTVNVDGRLELIGPGWYIRQIAGKGGINVLEGEVVFRKMPENFPFEEGESGNIDIYEGTVVFDCNYAPSDLITVQDWIDDGYITAYGGQANSIVDLYFDAEVEAIYLTARQDKRKAYYPVPFDGEQGFDSNEPLSWMVGTGAAEETLYLSKALRADLTGDDTVDIDDLLMFAANYLDDSWLAVDQADVTDDYEVNLRDLAVISSEWQDVLALAEIDTFVYGAGFDANEPFSYVASLNADSDYVWRVDGAVTGDTWLFTTAADPMLAFNQYPVNGDKNIVGSTVDLTWETAAAVDSCNVYFGDSYNGLSYQANTAAGTWTTPTLTAGQKYYWRIDTVEGATVHTGKVWIFSATSTPMGLYVESGTLKYDGGQFKGYGVNYCNPFTRCVQNPTDASYKHGFDVLGEKNIPFVRMWAGGFHVSDWNMYFEDKEQYFAILDDVMASAEENNVGVIFSIFWSWYALPDVVGEHVNAWGDANSATSQFMETYIRELYERYKNCPSFWGWELGNEYNLAAERNTLANGNILPVYGHPTKLDSINPVSRDNTLDRIDMTLLRQIASNFYTAVRKVDKNRMVTNGLSMRLDPSSSTPDYGQPEREIDHEMVDVASIHYYGHTANGATPAALYAAVSDTAGWGQPLFVGEFGVSENADLDEVHDGGYATVEEAIGDMVNDMVSHGVTFACAWVYDFSERGLSHEVRSNNHRSYILDLISDANASMNP